MKSFFDIHGRHPDPRKETDPHGLTLGEFLKFCHDNNVPLDAKFVIRGEVVVTPVVTQGRFTEGYYNPQFNATPKGRNTAIQFLAHSETSDGEVGLSII